MHAFLQHLRDLIASSMDDFSNDHSPVAVSSCGMVCFYAERGLRDTSAEPNATGSPWNGDRVALGDLSAQLPGS